MNLLLAPILSLTLLPTPHPQGGAKAPGNRILSDAELRDLGKYVLKHFKAKEEGKKENETLDKLLQELRDIEKKKKLGDSDYLLKHPLEWERLLDFGEDYATGALASGSEKLVTVDDHRFLISVPKNYDKKEASPLLMVIPDNGKDSPKDHFQKFWSDPALKDNFIICIPQMPEDLNTWTEPEGYGKALSPFVRVSRVTHIDCNRVFLSGVGAGAKAAAMIASFFPSRFAGLILRGNEVGNPIAENFGALPVFVAKPTGGDGGLGPDLESFLKRLDALGHKQVTQGEEAPASIAAWAADKVRNNYPLVVTFRPAKTFARSAYWVRLDRWETETENLPIEQQPFLKAVVDREKNQITVTATAVYRYILYFNDLMVDLDKPVTVVTNGKAWVGTIPRSLPFFLDLAFTRNDNRQVFSGTHILDAPTVADGSSKGDKDSK